jgi:uncharacterized protein (TIGR00661 family)
LRILYAFQGTGNGHVARARDLVPRFAAYAEVDVLVSGLETEIELNFPVKYRKRGLSMVYDRHGAVSYWKSLISNRPIRFLIDLIRLDVKAYDLVIIDFEALTSYSCTLKGVRALQLSHQAAYWSKETPRPPQVVRHWEWVLRYMSPSAYAIGFHFDAFDRFILPPIIRKEIRELNTVNAGHYTVYLPSFHPSVLEKFFSQFSQDRFMIFAKESWVSTSPNCTLFKANVDGFLASFKTCSGIICGAGFELPAEALFHGKKCIVCPIQGQYEQFANAAGIKRLGVDVFYDLSEESVPILQRFFESEAGVRRNWPDYAQSLVECILQNVKENRPLDDISTLQVW